MLFPRRACSTGVVLASVLLGGCGATIYTPRPSPRIQVVPDGSGLALVKNGRHFTTGTLGGGVEEAVEGNPQAEEEAREYRHRGVAGFILSTVGSVTAGVGAGVLVGNELQQNPSSTLLDASIAMTIGGAVLSIIGSLVASSAQPHLWNAINMYNDGLQVAVPVWSAAARLPRLPLPRPATRRHPATGRLRSPSPRLPASVPLPPQAGVPSPRRSLPRRSLPRRSRPRRLRPLLHRPGRMTLAKLRRHLLCGRPRRILPRGPWSAQAPAGSRYHQTPIFCLGRPPCRAPVLALIFLAAAYGCAATGGTGTRFTESTGVGGSGAGSSGTIGAGTGKGGSNGQGGGIGLGGGLTVPEGGSSDCAAPRPSSSTSSRWRTTSGASIRRASSSPRWPPRARPALLAQLDGHRPQPEWPGSTTSAASTPTTSRPWAPARTRSISLPLGFEQVGWASRPTPSAAPRRPSTWTASAAVASPRSTWPP